MKTLARRPLAAIVRLAVFSLVSLLATVSPAAKGNPAKPVENPASASPCLKYLPADCWAVGEVNWKAVVTFLSTPEAKLNPQRVQFEQAMQMVQLMTGIDGEKEVDRIAVFAMFDSAEELAGAVAIQGSFSNLVVERRLRLSLPGTATTKIYKGHTVYRVNDVTFCLPGRSTLLVGDDCVVRQSLDRFEAAAGAVPQALQNVLERTPSDSVAWVAICPPRILAHRELAEWRGDNPAAYSNLSKLESISLAIKLGGDGLRIDGVGYVSDLAEARTVYRYLRDQKRDLLQTEGVNLVLASLLVLSDLDQSGNYVRGSFGLNLNGVVRLWNTKFIIKP